jgi:hypothetical protein
MEWAGKRAAEGAGSKKGILLTEGRDRDRADCQGAKDRSWGRGFTKTTSRPILPLNKDVQIMPADFPKK